MYRLIFLLPLLLAGTGCIPLTSSLDEPSSTLPPEASSRPLQEASEQPSSTLVFPIHPDAVIPQCHLTFKGFGEYIQDRFRGYHTGIDCEMDQTLLEAARAEDRAQGVPEREIAIRAIAPGRVTFASRVSGYGGVMVIAHDIEGEIISALYGHLDPTSFIFSVGADVEQGAALGFLGEQESSETDGERMHLHFGMWKGEEVKLKGYVSTSDALSGWLNPYDIFLEYGGSRFGDTFVLEQTPDRSGSDPFDALHLRLPEGWSLEYIPQIEAMSVYTAQGEGPARERSQLFIRFFDADTFLTLSTVDILSSENIMVGDDYEARRYEIQKKDGVSDFPFQPSWRNDRHIVVDVHVPETRRYYVFAASPDLDPDVFSRLLTALELDAL